jgi:hypothetical protein
MHQAWFRDKCRIIFDVKIRLIFPLGIFTQNIGTRFVLVRYCNYEERGSTRVFAPGCENEVDNITQFLHHS